MISIKLIYIQNNKKKQFNDFEEDIIRRLKKNIKCILKPLSHKKKFSSIEELKNYEGNLISKELRSSSTSIFFDKSGIMLTSEKFAQVIFNSSSQLDLVIGGTYGLSDQVKLKADRIISFSDMEFAHDLFRLMLLEQLYRSHCINTGHPYHQNDS